MIGFVTIAVTYCNKKSKAYFVVFPSRRATCRVTFPVRIPLKIALASEWNSPWVERPFPRFLIRQGSKYATLLKYFFKGSFKIRYFLKFVNHILSLFQLFSTILTRHRSVSIHDFFYNIGFVKLAKTNSLCQYGKVEIV